MTIQTMRDFGIGEGQLYIGGRWVPVGARAIRVDDPATGEIIGSVPRLGRAETREAIEAARAALPSWRVRTASSGRKTISSERSESRFAATR